MDPLILNIVKVTSMTLAGLFGLIGTFKDFSANSKAKRWRNLTIVGIVSTTLLSVVIQNLEYLANARAQQAEAKRLTDTANTLKAITDTTALTTRKSNEIQEAQKSTLTATADIRNQVERSAAAQAGLVNKQEQAVSSMGQLLNPLDPLGFGLSLDYDFAKNACLVPFVERVRKYIQQRRLLEGGVVEGDPGTVVHLDDAGQPRGATLTAASKALLEADGLARDALQPSTWIRFHPAGRAIPYQSNGTVDTGVEYSVRFERDDDKDDLWLRDLLPARRNNLEIDISFDLKDGDVSVELGAAGVRRNNEDTSYRSVSNLIGTTLEIFLTHRPVSGCPAPELDEFAIAWGQNYVFVADFDVDDFQTRTTANGTSFSIRIGQAHLPSAMGR